MRVTAGDILDLLGNATRREILKLIAEEPRYVTELSQETGVRKMAIERHVRQLEGFGVISSQDEKIGRGRPRKYYGISTRAKLKVKISPNIFQTSYWSCGERKNEELGLEYESLVRAEGLRDPIEKLSVLSRIAEKLTDRIKSHEEAIARDEELLERVKKAGLEALKGVGLDSIERRLLLNILLSGKGKKSREVAEEVGENPSKVRRRLRKMKYRNILRCHYHNWKIK
jgi:ArsR family transcriptional regulator